MNHIKSVIIFLLHFSLLASLYACSSEGQNEETGKEYIEETLNLANNEEQEWTYAEDDDAWVLSVVPAVAYPELEDQQGVSVCVPGAYITGIDTNGDGSADITPDTYKDAVKGSLVIDFEAEITSSNGQVYTCLLYTSPSPRD